MIGSFKKALTAFFIVGSIHFLLKLKTTRQFVFPNILTITHLVLIGYLFYVLFDLLKSKGKAIQIFSIFVLLIFPIGFLSGLISGIDEKFLVVYPVAVIAVLYLFGEYMALRGERKKKTSKRMKKNKINSSFSDALGDSHATCGNCGK